MENGDTSVVALKPDEKPKEEGERLTETLTTEDALNSSNAVQEAYRLTGNSKTYAKYAMYATNGFKSPDELSNEVKQILAVSQVTSADMDSKSTKKVVTSDVVASYAKKVFGEEAGKIEHEDFILYNNDANFANVYRTVAYSYDKDDANYEIVEGEGEEENPSEIVELLTKAEVYNTKIVLYVSPIFIECGYKEESNSIVAFFYKNYDFNSKSFPMNEEPELAITYDDYKNKVKQSYTQDVDNLKYEVLNDPNVPFNPNQLQEYKYTLVKNDDGKYELRSLEIVGAEDDEPLTPVEGNEENENSSARPRPSGNAGANMTEQEKSEFNSDIEIYAGDDLTGSDVKKVMEEIMNKNEDNENDLDKIISLKFNNQSYVLEDEVVNLNDKIAIALEKIDYSATYSVEPIYSNGIIISVEIEKN